MVVQIHNVCANFIEGDNNLSLDEVVMWSTIKLRNVYSGYIFLFISTVENFKPLRENNNNVKQ